MFGFGLYGAPIVISDEEVKVERMGPEIPRGKVRAKLVSTQDDIQHIRPIVSVNGQAVADPGVWIAWSNPAVVKDKDTVSTPVGRCKLFRPQMAAGTGIVLHDGSKIGDGGPVDRVWVHGTYQGKEIVSDIFVTGMVDTEIVRSPVFELVYERIA